MKKNHFGIAASPAAAIEHGRAVIAQEIKGLHALLDALDGRFAQAVERIGAVKGRLIVSGMGKSGHIARKIAATLASTGTPAYFVHPAEASHGDLGMITPQDGVLVLSNSGETAELGSLIAYCKRSGILLVAVVRRATSMLVEAADIALVLPDIPEASPTNAPTTSTTMMLSLGDALAVALMERKGFSPDQYRDFHPGGSLGRALIRVADLMHSGDAVPLAAPDTAMPDLLLTMASGRLGCVGIVDDTGALAGIVT
ncbi:MAG: KpsF/GutQ family sugar-phosphate isomerase, partial [Alphaproteobacteria bacterium]|nr:KpsF/GutQ family sugar-phosphate isomerase [Alphaproteobacteria bacterium]